MKVKTSELIGPALDWAVAAALNPTDPQHGWDAALGKPVWTPYSTGWAYAGPIIERERLHLIPLVNPWHGLPWHCSTLVHADAGVPLYDADGPTALIAAMRCFVASKLGDEVDVPEELL